MTASSTAGSPTIHGQAPAPRTPAGRARAWAHGLVVALVPLVAVAELIAGARQERRVASRAQWQLAALAAIAASRAEGSNSLPIVTSPRWATPDADLALGGFEASPMASASDRRAVTKPPIDTHTTARIDLDTAPHVVELSVDGSDDPALKGWKIQRQERFGPLTLRVLDNPTPSVLLRDLSDEIDATAKVYRLEATGAKAACRWESGGAQKLPNLNAGPMPPAQRFLCPPFDPGWTFVGPTVLTDLTFTPRRCIMMHPDRDSTVTIELPARAIGRRIVAYVGVQALMERELKFAPIQARISVGGVKVAEVRHVDGEGWKRFEGDTTSMAGTKQPVKLELWAEQGESQFRLACMAAQVRE